MEVMTINYPNEKREDYIRDDYFIYGVRCLNCGEVTRYVVQKETHDNNARKFITFTPGEKGYSYDYCEWCELYTKRELITMTPPEE